MSRRYHDLNVLSERAQFATYSIKWHIHLLMEEVIPELPLKNITSENSPRPLESGELFAASPKHDCNRWTNGRCISLVSLALTHKALTFT